MFLGLICFQVGYSLLLLSGERNLSLKGSLIELTPLQKGWSSWVMNSPPLSAVMFYSFAALWPCCYEALHARTVWYSECLSHTFIHAPNESPRKIVFIQVYTCTGIFVEGCVKETRHPELCSVTQRYPNTAAAFEEECLLLQRARVVQGEENQRSDWIKQCCCNPELKPPCLCFKHSDKHS